MPSRRVTVWFCAAMLVEPLVNAGWPSWAVITWMLVSVVGAAQVEDRAGADQGQRIGPAAAVDHVADWPKAFRRGR